MQSDTKSPLFNKVANITILFWIIKIISTTVGEASSDFLSHQFGSTALVVTLLLLVASIFIQIRFKRYVPWMYWTVIILIAVFGTMTSDGLHHLGMPIEATTALFFVILLIIFRLWHRSEKTLDVHAIHTTKRELFYWAVIFFTFALGTAAGDLVASGLHFGLLDATLIFGIAMVVIPLALYCLRINSIALFWITYILTRPFGAAGADLIGKPVSHGGFGLGDGTTAVLSLIITVALIAYLTITHKKAMLFEERTQ